jgi:hypothetical protein
MKLLAVWTGVVSGSLGGRDDGYPEEKYRVFSSFNELPDSLCKEPTLKIYRLHKILKEDWAKLWEVAIRRQIEEDEAAERAKDLEILRHLREKYPDVE